MFLSVGWMPACCVCVANVITLIENVRGLAFVDFLGLISCVEFMDICMEKKLRRNIKRKQIAHLPFKQWTKDIC